MAIKTYAQQLEEVQATIGRIEKSGQSYTVGDRSLTRADVETLYARERFLRTQADRESRGGVQVKTAVTP